MKKKKKCTITKDREYALYTTHKYESDNHIFYLRDVQSYPKS